LIIKKLTHQKRCSLNDPRDDYWLDIEAVGMTLHDR
jgi:hypothetical protein